jgi:hypothetical protein
MPTGVPIFPARCGRISNGMSACVYKCATSELTQNRRRGGGRVLAGCLGDLATLEGPKAGAGQTPDIKLVQPLRLSARLSSTNMG